MVWFPKRILRLAWPIDVWVLRAAVSVLAVCCLAVAQAALVEREIRAALLSFGAALVLWSALGFSFAAQRRGWLERPGVRAVTKVMAALVVLVPVLALLTSDRSIPDKSISVTTPAQKYDATEQPGNDILAKVERNRASDELTFSVYDVCSGKLTHRAARDGEVAAQRVEVTNPGVLTAEIRDQAVAMGADVVGVTRLLPQFVFKRDNDGHDVHLKHEYAIVIGKALDYRLASPAAPLPWKEYYSSIPEDVAAVLSGRGEHTGVQIPPETVEEYRETLEFFAEGGRIAVQVAQHLRSLGYPARAHFGRWSEVQVIPLAIAAGLGEVGRNGMLISPQLGPRGSFAIVTTDIPLVVDHQRDFGIQEFCRVCKKCARACPVDAVPHGEAMAAGGPTRWRVDGAKCWSYLKINPKCMACTGSCPFNKRDLWIHRVANAVIARKSIVANWLLVQLDDLLGYGRSAFRLRDEARAALGVLPAPGPRGSP